ncbi:MAG TPA: acylphosphatase, partial [Balneolaceae bacterium]|nr:acylphosphatase [Balneolaceae bacterium]
MNQAESVTKRAHIFIEGKVQGVGFRYFVRTNASDMNLKGWVKNLSDGRVEAVFEGPKAKVMSMVEKCQ